MLAFLATDLGRRLLAGAAVVVLVVAILAEVRHSGAESVRKANAKAEAAAKADVKAHEAKAQAITDQASRGVKAAHDAVARRIAPLVKRIYVDVPPEADRDCVVPKSFVSLWNSAAGDGPGVPASPGGPEKRASGPHPTP